jgi:hypothetical protein
MNEYRSVRDDGSATSGFFEPFDLSVNLGPGDIPWLSATSQAGSLHGIPRRAGSLPQLPDLLDMVYDYTDAVQFAEMQPTPELSEILGELIFGDPMLLQLFQATRGVAADRGRQLLFRILASPHLAVLPWELLPDPAAVHRGHGPRYLALAPDTHLVRLARGLTYPARAALLEAPLNLLLVLSSPTPEVYSEDWLAFDIFELKRGLLAELSPLVQAGMLHIDVEDRPTLDNLRRRIGAQRRGYHLFHYVGHAKPGQLILEDRAGRREDVTSSQFMEILRLCPDLRLSVFAGCETARPDRDPASLDTQAGVGWRHLLSLADYCVQEACPAVIGMQAVLPFSTERVFTRFFYQALASGYSVAEAMRLARGAIHGDERLGGDLLDWSVPTLFVGSSEPGALVPRSAPSFKPASSSKRWDLKLGLRQSEARFFARELPLRQAVDIMTGQTPERVLLVTGAVGVGKTTMVDLVLEELGDKVTHVLYVYFDRLAPEVVDACRRLETGELPDLAKLIGLKADHALNRLCRLVSELLHYSGIRTRAYDSKWSTGEWWERMIEDLVQHRFVLVVDEIGLLDRTQRRLLEVLLEPWLTNRVDNDLKATSGDQLLDNLQKQLSRLQETQKKSQTGSLGASMNKRPGNSLNETHLVEMRKYLDGLPERLLDESRQILGDLLERQVVTLSYSLARKALAKKAEMKVDSSIKPRGHVPNSLYNNVIAALKALEDVRMYLGAAIRVLAERRSNARILLTAVEKPRNFLDLPEDQVFEMRLAHLTWSETWRSIRRNLPALLSYGDVFLSRLWSRLGVRLDRWEELERRVLRDHARPLDLQAIAEQIAPSPLATPLGTGTLSARRSQRPLRIAVAGPFISGSSAMGDAITRLAIEHGIGGRVVEFDEAGALASLIDESSPFADTGSADMTAILEWLKRVLAKQPDIILLDYGSGKSPEAIAKSQEKDAERILLRSMQYGSLLIAAGGNEGQDSVFVSTPSGYSEVLGVGPLDNDGRLREYAEWHPKLGKPDLFMADDLSTTALAAALKPELLSTQREIYRWGSSFSALHAVATATLVWSILPELSARGIRALLVEASKPIAEAEYPRSLTMRDAIAKARVRVVERTLRGGASSLQTLSAMTGLEVGVLSATLDSLTEEGRVVRLSSGRLERFQLIE